MKRWLMYYSIHNMSKEGFSKRKIAEKLEIDFRTVNKYLAMTPEEFNKRVLTKERQQNLSLYEGVVIGWLEKHPDMTAAQVHDWLKEHYQVKIAERTVRRYVGNIRKKHGIPKDKGETRQYTAVEDPPMGQQMQVDIGEIWVIDAYKRCRTKLYCVAAVLSHSRYKWGEWQNQPLTSARFIQALQSCFEYMGGMPKELVFDQDRLLAVDENYGDIIFTKEFEQYKQVSGFQVYLCRGNDPESKGRTEAVIKYFKGNFAKNRQFMGIDIWNADFEDWLSRTGNIKEHGTTKKVPAKIFKQEILFLKPVPSTKKIYTDIITRKVHKDNTVFYEGNRYTVPIGTYAQDLEVSLIVENNRLIISSLFGDYIIAEHTLSKNKGELIINNHHERDTTTKLDSLQAELKSKIGNNDENDETDTFLTQIRRLKPRYARDQYKLIGKTLEAYGQPAIEKALRYCVVNNLYSAVEFRNAAEYFDGRLETEREQPEQSDNLIFINSAARSEVIEPEISVAKHLMISKKRDLAEYTQATKEGVK